LDVEHERLDVALRGRGRRREAKRTVVRAREPTIQSEDMKVHVEVETASIPLHERDGATLRISLASCARKFT
jgi:hypothetical protein